MLKDIKDANDPKVKKEKEKKDRDGPTLLTLQKRFFKKRNL
jgi:hypothetical protein